jgi:vesicular inhibitory amino acid transporter
MSDNKDPTAASQDDVSSSVYIRVPLNTHPSRLNTPTGYGTLHDDRSSYYFNTTMGDNASNNNGGIAGSPSSSSFFRGFAGSYSRTSALYMAENLSIQHHTNDSLSIKSEPAATATHDHLIDEESTIKTKLLPMDHTLTQTISQHCGLLYMGLSRHTTAASMMSQQFPQTTASLKSTFVQSVFNSINVLVGIGVLALPLAFRCAGWFFGSLVFLFCVLATNYTAKVIAKCLDFHPNSTTYGDMGAAAFGDRGRTFVSAVFVVELMTIGQVCICKVFCYLFCLYYLYRVAMVVLLGDGIQTLFPQIDMLTIRVTSFVVLTPMLFLPLRKLAYTSLIGILSCACLVVIVIYDGLSKKERPGSLIDPMVCLMLNIQQTRVLTFIIITYRKLKSYLLKSTIFL